MGAHGDLERLTEDLGWRIEDVAKQREDLWWATAEEPASTGFGSIHSLVDEVATCSVWFRCRNDAIRQMVTLAGEPTTIWDVGAGIGVVAQALQDAGKQVIAIEPDGYGARRARERGIEHVICGTLEMVHLPDASVSSVGLFDVIEHIADPRPLLGEVRRVLRPGAPVIVSVPAFNFLWSAADDIAGHFRRYTRAQLSTLLAECGFARIADHYLFAAAVPLVWLRRTIPSRLGIQRSDEEVVRDLRLGNGRIGPLLLKAASTYTAAELHWSRRHNLPVGTSVLAAYAPVV